MRPRVCGNCHLVNWPTYLEQHPRMLCLACRYPTRPLVPFPIVELFGDPSNLTRAELRDGGSTYFGGITRYR
jgi:hypothetical protein